MSRSPFLLFAAMAVGLSSCAVREEYSVDVGTNNQVSLENKKVFSWFGEDVEELPYNKPLGSDEGHGQWSQSQIAGDQHEGWAGMRDSMEAENRYGGDR